MGAPPAEHADSIRRSMRTLTGLMPDRAVAVGTAPREAAHALVADRLPVIAERFGWRR